MTPEGHLAALWYEGRWGLITSLEGHQDGLLIYGPDKNVMTSMIPFISGQTENLALDTSLAINGEGTIYALSQDEGQVFIFSPEGKFIDKFGVYAPGTTSSVSGYAISVDGQGRVYVASSRQVLVFTTDGKPLATIPLSTSLADIEFDRQNHLWVLTEDSVNEFVLNSGFTGK